VDTSVFVHHAAVAGSCSPMIPVVEYGCCDLKFTTSLSKQIMLSDIFEHFDPCRRHFED
jgi:hypothetical protein